MVDMKDEFEWEFQAFVERGGLDETRSISEDYERTRRALMCIHEKMPGKCTICLIHSPAPKPYGHDR
jgi:hypothetical protein